MKIYKTKFNSFQNYLTSFISQIFVGPWKVRSLSLFSLLFGFYLASTFTSYFIDSLNQRLIVAIVLYILIELTIRYRNIFISLRNRLILVIVDNIRIGITYAIVLEAFKLGS